jgi:hypothetical protein
MVGEPRGRAGVSPTAKVIGLGAPTSVRILFELAEVPALLDAIGDELARYGCASEIRGRTLRADSAVDPADWRYHVAELHRMLGDIERAAEPRYAFDRVDVLWPTVLARGVLHRAVAHGERRAQEGGKDGEEALAAARRTLRDYEAVDAGGLLDVWL